MEDFEKNHNSIKLATEKSGVKIVTGDTKL